MARRQRSLCSPHPLKPNKLACTVRWPNAVPATESSGRGLGRPMCIASPRHGIGQRRGLGKEEGGLVPVGRRACPVRVPRTTSGLGGTCLPASPAASCRRVVSSRLSLAASGPGSTTDQDPDLGCFLVEAHTSRRQLPAGHVSIMLHHPPPSRACVTACPQTGHPPSTSSCVPLHAGRFAGPGGEAPRTLLGRPGQRRSGTRA